MSTICKLQIYTLVISSYWYIIHIVLYLLLGVKPSIYWRDWHWGLEKFHSLSSSEPLRRTLLSVTKMLGNIWQSWLAILFPRTSDFHPQATGFWWLLKICLCSKLGRGWPFLTVLTTSGVWSTLFKAFTSEYCSSYPSKRCFVPAHFCLQIGFDETNSFPDRHAFSPAREARPSPSSRSYQGWLWGR